MTDARSGGPHVPSADDAVERVRKGIEKWQRSGGRAPAPAFQLHGKQGVGKTTAILSLREELSRQGLRPLLASPPEVDLDASLHVAVQVASHLRSHGSNGALDVLSDPGADASAKNEAVLEELMELENGVLLLDLPRSWSADSSASQDQFARARAGALVSALITRAQERRIPVILAARGSWRWPDAVASPWLVKVVPSSEGGGLLRDTARWGALQGAASRLAALLGGRRDHAEEMSPLELRVAVALVALDFSESDVRTACFGGLKALVRLLAEEAARRSTLRAALRALSFVRFPVDAGVVDALLDANGAGDAGSSWERLVVKDALLIEREGGFLLPPGLRSFQDHEVGHEGPPGPALHAVIADALTSPAGAPLLGSRAHAIRKLERLHHAACALQRDVVVREAFDDAQVCTLARAFSLAGEKEDALALYETVLARSPRHPYARAYVAYHLEHLGLDPLRAEALFEESHADDPKNAWWARRYICCLIRRGRTAEARDAWLEALGRLSEEEEGEEREDWLARNFHAGIARQLLSRGALEPAREVLTAIHEETRRNNGEIAEMWNELCHMEESEHLGGAVFPLTIPFSIRWNGPHIEGLRSPDSPIEAWYPGKILHIGERIALRLAEPPPPGGEPRLLRSEMTRDGFLSCARRSSMEGISAGQFLEAIVSGTDTRIELHPVRRRGLRVSVGFLRRMEEPV